MEGQEGHGLMEAYSKQNHWYLLTGLLLGVAIGLVISLILVPAVNADALPNELSEQAKADYREMIALSYTTNHDLERALSRLELLQDPDPVGILISQAQELLASGGSETTARALAELGTRLNELLTPSSP
ncbi:MAG: hypothetical protein PHT43_01305 [Anaerolineaceae bacterium]|nr:hypothetical protein [Anaerolineaceae bacterium]